MFKKSKKNDDTKGVSRSRKQKDMRQNDGQRKKEKYENKTNGLQTTNELMIEQYKLHSCAQ